MGKLARLRRFLTYLIFLTKLSFFVSFYSKVWNTIHRSFLTKVGDSHPKSSIVLLLFLLGWCHLLAQQSSVYTSQCLVAMLVSLFARPLLYFGDSRVQVSLVITVTASAFRLLILFSVIITLILLLGRISMVQTLLILWWGLDRSYCWNLTGHMVPRIRHCIWGSHALAIRVIDIVTALQLFPLLNNLARSMISSPILHH